MTNERPTERPATQTPEAASEAAREAAQAFFELMPYQKRHVEKQAATMGLSMPLCGVLWQLRPDRPASMGTIAEFMHCDASNVTSMVDKLENRGLLRRQSSPEDRRVKLIALTDEGLEFREALFSRVCEPQPWILALDEQDQLELARILRKARERIASAGE